MECCQKEKLDPKTFADLLQRKHLPILKSWHEETGECFFPQTPMTATAPSFVPQPVKQSTQSDAEQQLQRDFQRLKENVA